MEIMLFSLRIKLEMTNQTENYLIVNGIEFRQHDSID